MTWADDDAHELQVRRRAAFLADQPHPLVDATGSVRGRTDPLPGREHLLSQIGVGWEVFSMTRAVLYEEHSMGGIVIEIIDRTWPDYLTGEMLHRIVYKTFDLFIARHLSWGHVESDDVDAARIQPPSRTNLTSAVRRLCRYVAEGKPRWLNPADLDHLAVIGRLTRAVET